MRKRQWVAEVYGFICEDYIKNKPESTKDTLERILFLMQYDSLYHDKKKCFLPYKIYIDEKGIRVRYISDILRVRQTMPNFARGGGRALPSWRGMKDILKYTKIFNKFKRLSVEEIEIRVQSILDTEELNPKYFVFGKYEDKWSRRLARLWSRQEESFFKWVLWFLMTLIAVPTLITIIPILYTIIAQKVANPLLLFSRYIITALVLSGPWLLWTWKWMNTPTQFEVENGYDI